MQRRQYLGSEGSPGPAKVLAVALCIGAVVVAHPAEAQVTTSLPTAAEEFFREGRAAVKKGDFERACTLFRQSYGADPAPGTLLNIADCEEHTGKLVDALQDFTTTTKLLPESDDRMPIARARIADLDKRIPHLVVQITGGSSSWILTLEGVPDGSGRTPSARAFVPHEWVGKPMPLVPGTYLARLSEGPLYADQLVTLQGSDATPLVFDLGALERDRKELDAKAAEARRQAAEENDRAVADNLARATESRRRSEEEANERTAEAMGAGKTGTMIGIGIGFFAPAAVALSVGAWSGVQVLNDKATVAQDCKGKQCTQAGLDAASDGSGNSIVSPIVLGVGAVLVATGVYVLVNYDHSHPGQSLVVAARGTPGGTMLTLEQRF